MRGRDGKNGESEWRWRRSCRAITPTQPLNMRTKAGLRLQSRDISDLAPVAIAVDQIDE